MDKISRLSQIFDAILARHEELCKKMTVLRKEVEGMSPGIRRQRKLNEFFQATGEADALAWVIREAACRALQPSSSTQQ